MAKEVKTLSVENVIRLDGGTQPRASIDYGLVGEYAELYQAGIIFPPIIVFYDGVDHWLADGFHRWHAARKAGLEISFVKSTRAVREDARWFSYSANQAHGQRRSNEDKRKAVQSALSHPKGAKLSDGQIAEHCGVSSNTVLKYREEMVRLRKLRSQPNALVAMVGQLTPRISADGRSRLRARMVSRKVCRLLLMRCHLHKWQSANLNAYGTMIVIKKERMRKIENWIRQKGPHTIKGRPKHDLVRELLGRTYADWAGYSQNVPVSKTSIPTDSKKRQEIINLCKNVQMYVTNYINKIEKEIENQARETVRDSDDEPLTAAAIICPNCGGHAATEDGDCASCYEPGIVAAEGK